MTDKKQEFITSGVEKGSEDRKGLRASPRVRHRGVLFVWGLVIVAVVAGIIFLVNDWMNSKDEVMEEDDSNIAPTVYSEEDQREEDKGANEQESSSDEASMEEDNNPFLDNDGDGLLNVQEKQYGTNPNKIDTDGDGYGDGEEVQTGHDPLTPAK